jgi:hypothetical protein
MLTDVSEVRTASIIIALMMEAARMSETSVNANLNTRQCIPEDSKLHWSNLLEEEDELQCSYRQLLKEQKIQNRRS